MTMVNPDRDRCKFFKILTFHLDDITRKNDEYIDKPYSRVSHIFQNTWLSRYPHSRKLVFENVSDLKRDFTPLLKYFLLNLS